MRMVVVAALAGCSYNPATATTDGTGGDGPGDGAGDAAAAGPVVPSNQSDTSALDATGLPSLIAENLATDGATTWRIYTDTGLIQRESTSQATFVEYRPATIGLDPGTQLRLDHTGSFAVLYVDRFRVDPMVFFEGHGDRPLIVIARDTIVVAGEIDFSGGFATPGALAANFRLGGPGGGDGAANTAGVDNHAQGCGGSDGDGGRSAGVGSNGDASGGGGGGGGLVGGKGGDKSTGSDDGGAGGPACITADLIPLVGGGGGGSADTAGSGAGGGGGGGAIQLTSMVSITITGVIDVGGKGGFGEDGNDEGGGGGGAGGGILLEAPVVTMTSGALAANGGGGGSGRAQNPGQQGTLTTAAALGGLGSGAGDADGRGGNGGAAEAAATGGDNNDPGGGGGGGASGVVRINAEPNKLTLLGGIISPQHTVGAVVFGPSP